MIVCSMVVMLETSDFQKMVTESQQNGPHPAWNFRIKQTRYENQVA